MHTYSVKLQERISVLGALGILSTLVILTVQKYLPHWVPVPSVFALFSGLVFFFNKWGWRWRICQATFINTPDLNGEWEMLTRSSIKKNQEEYKAVLTINQTWTSICLFMEGEKTISESVMAGIEVKTDNLFFLKWEYRAEYKPMHAAQNKIHYGITKVVMRPVSNPEKLEGNYYTDESRDSHGPVTLHKIKKA